MILDRPGHTHPNTVGKKWQLAFQARDLKKSLVLKEILIVLGIIILYGFCKHGSATVPPK